MSTFLVDTQQNYFFLTVVTIPRIREGRVREDQDWDMEAGVRGGRVRKEREK